MIRLGVLLSGRGSNMLALAEACRSGALPAEIACVASNLASAPGLGRARDLGLEAVAIDHREHPDRESFERALAARLQAAGVEWVCLAGFMRLLSAVFLAEFPERVVNIHPSLLPAFPGLEAQAQALAHGVRISGCTVHLVDSGLDSGPIVVQRSVPVLEGDTAASLAARILLEEHLAYPEAMRLLLTRSWRVEGRRLRISG